MGVTLARAWEVARLMDEADAADCRREVERALALTTPTSGSGKGDGGHASRVARLERNG